MDGYLLNAAVLFALSTATKASTAIDGILASAPFAHNDLDQLSYELLDVQAPLESLQKTTSVPQPLQGPLFAIVRTCGESLSSLQTVLTNNGSTPDLKMSLSLLASVIDVEFTSRTLQVCRRTLQAVLTVLNSNNTTPPGFSENGSISGSISPEVDRLSAMIKRLSSQIPFDSQGQLNAVLKGALDDICVYLSSSVASPEPSIRSSAASLSSPITQALDTATLTNGQTVISPTPNATFGLFPRQQRPPSVAPSMVPTITYASNEVATSFKSLTKAIGKWSLATPRQPSLTAPAIPEKSHARASHSVSTTDNSVPTTPSRSTTQHHRVISAPTSSIESPVTDTSASCSQSPNPRQSYLTVSEELPSPYFMHDGGLGIPQPDESNMGMRANFGHGLAIPSAIPIIPSAEHNIEPSDKFIVTSVDTQVPANGAKEQTLCLMQVKLLNDGEKGQRQPIHAMEASPAAYILAARSGDKTLRIYGLPQSNLQSTLKVGFYIEMQPRSRDFFVQSHAILSETRNLVAVATAFGHTLEIWDWARRKKMQAIKSAYRWAASRLDIFETYFSPLACYDEETNAISLYPVRRDLADSAKKPFGKPTIIDLAAADLPHIPKYPELAYSSTSPLLVAAAGPRPPRAGHAPPQHSAMLMLWDLSERDRSASGRSSSIRVSTSTANTSALSSRPTRFIAPTQYPQLETALPCGLATHSSLAVSIWIPNNVRVIGRAGLWQVEPSPVTKRHVLVWDFAADTTECFEIPNARVCCVSPDCRWVAYVHVEPKIVAGGEERAWMAVLDVGRKSKKKVTAGQEREVWRYEPGLDAGANMVGSGGLREQCDLRRVTSLAFSGDGQHLFIGDADGNIGVHNVS